MKNYIEHDNEIVFHPGFYVNEIIIYMGLTQKEFAVKLGVSFDDIHLLVHGKQNLTKDIAIKLSNMFETSLEYWLNLQKQYDQFEVEHKIK